MGNVWTYGSELYDSRMIITSLLSLLIRKKLDLTDEELNILANTFVANLDKTEYSSGIPVKPLLTKIENNFRQKGLSDHLTSALKLLFTEENAFMSADLRKNNEQILYLLQGAPEISPDSGDDFGRSVLGFLAEIKEAEVKKNWSNLIKHFILTAGKSNPTDKWMKDAKEILSKIGSESFIDKSVEWLNLCVGILKQIHKAGSHQHVYLMEVNHDLLKGLIWLSGTINDPEINHLLDEYGIIAFKKLYGVGAVSVKTGNACLYSFSILPFKDGISRLTKFRMKIKYPSVIKQVDKYIQLVAKKEGYSRERLEELAVPDYGIENGKICRKVNSYIAVIEIKTIFEIELYWENEGKKQSSIPSKIKEENKEELASLKKSVKEIEGILPIQRDRIEQFYIRSRTWKFNDWLPSYIEHPLMSIISSKLIWHFSENDKKDQGIFIDGKIKNLNNKIIEWLTDTTEVQLWHPIGFPADTVLKWREFLETAQIKQPFKQAYREVYLLTDAELNTHSYSNRFAAHILRQFQFTALCKQRGWNYTLMGNWDSHNTPFINLPTWNIRAEYYVDADWDNNAASETGIFNYISTDQVRFYKDNEQLIMSEVPAMVFTEVMRDIDLFVGVTSIGNDPAWADNPNQQMNTYWREYSFAELTESSKIREQVLKKLIPRLKIAEICSFDNKFLTVKGKLRTYKIHMGSGNILMLPNDEYLCIVPSRSDRSTEKLFLPFEGDNMLSIIISKALLLAEDNKITDKTITSQINR